MAWFGNWFSKKNTAVDGFAQDSGLFDQSPAAKSAAAGSPNAAGRKGQRMEQRELLYAVVRETMTRLGMIATSYKYKVLSLDTQGRQYLIMMDIKHDPKSQMPLMSKLELMLTQEAKSRHGIQITGVYWRFIEPTSPLEPRLPTPDTSVKPALATPAQAPAPLKPPAVDPVDAKKALEKVLSKPRDHRAPVPTAFQDTLVLDTEEQQFSQRDAKNGALK